MTENCEGWWQNLRIHTANMIRFLYSAQFHFSFNFSVQCLGSAEQMVSECVEEWGQKIIEQKICRKEVQKLKQWITFYEEFQDKIYFWYIFYLLSLLIIFLSMNKVWWYHLHNSKHIKHFCFLLPTWDKWSLSSLRALVIALKGQCHEIVYFRFSLWIIFLQAPKNNIRVWSTGGKRYNC